MKEKEAYCKNSPDFRIHGCILQNRKYGRREYAGEEKVWRDQVIQEYIYNSKKCASRTFLARLVTFSSYKLFVDFC